MSKVAFIFPGQGSQKAGMGRAAALAFAEVREVFAEADGVLGFPLSSLCFEGPEEELRLTENTQPAILATSIALYRALEARGLTPSFVAGHSLGEYSALVAAGSLTFSDALQLVRKRGRYMQEAVPFGEGAMAAILGLGLAEVEAACREAAGDEVVQPANLNGPEHVVIAGHARAVGRASAKARERGARRVIPLQVSAPFHCQLMQPAAERLARDLAGIVFKDLRVPMVTNVDAVPIFTGGAAREALARQVASPVRWEETVRRLRAEGVSSFLEVGPGKVLSGLVRKIDGEARVASVGEPEDVEKVLGERAGG